MTRYSVHSANIRLSIDGGGTDGPVSPFRPRRWRGALVPHTAEIVLENLDADKRPLAATADFRELSNVVAVTIREDPSTSVQLLFDADHSLEERIIAEQFLG